MVLTIRQFALALNQIRHSALGRCGIYRCFLSQRGWCVALLFCLAPSGLYAQNQAPREVSVQIQSTKLRSSPQQWAAGNTGLHFGDRLAVISQNGPWLKVRTAKSEEGYIHETAVTSRKIVLSSAKVSLSDVAVDESQVYLATKGFNSQVEGDFKSQDPSANYSAVDAMKRDYLVSEERLLQFIEDGKLKKG